MFTVKRITEYDGVVFGALLDEDELLCLTLEEKKKEIPKGEYKLYYTMFFRGGYHTFGLQDVLDRTGILIHIGNTIADTTGCIILGMKPYKFGSDRGLAESKVAFKRFMGRAKRKETEELYIKIEDCIERVEEEEKKEPETPGLLTSLLRKALTIFIMSRRHRQD